MNALVTGGSGYFGCLLVEMLRKAGHSVRVFDIQDAEDRSPDVEFVQGDIRDADRVRQAVRGVSRVFHNVALVPLAKDKEAFWSVNRDGTEILLRESASANVQKVVNTSSSAVFGAPKKNPVTEETKPTPAEDYGKAKLAGEELCHEWSGRALDVTTIRPRTIMGHGRLGIMQILFEWVRQGRNIPVLGRGDNIYQFVHAEDLATACILASERPGSRIYNIGAEEFCTMRETLEALVSHANTGSKVRSVPTLPAEWGMKLSTRLGVSPLGPYHALMYGKSLYFDVARAKSELHWSSQYSNIEMFRETYDWYIANREAVLTVGRSASHHRSPVKQGVLDLFSRLL